MRIFGLIGKSLAHSFSKEYFTLKFKNEGIPDCSYELFQLDRIDKIQELFENYPDIEGLNVTIPYKQMVIPFLDELNREAEQTGAVNTIKVANSRLTGYNTDIYGFEKSIISHLKEHHISALILGSGGASQAAKFVFNKLGVDVTVVSRTPSNKKVLSYAAIDEQVIRDHKVIVNTTPLGMFPNTDRHPTLPYQFIGPDHLLFDMIYNPESTQFLKMGSRQGAIVQNGLEMLHLQAERSWEIWNS